MLTKFEKLKNEIGRKTELNKNLISYKDFLAKKLPPAKWIAEYLVPVGITILSSAPGQFKTFLLQQLAIEVSQGNPVFNHFKSEKMPVLFINEESSERILQERLKAFKEPEAECYYMNLAGIKISNGDVPILLDICKEKGIKLIIFDSLTRIHDFSENDAGEVKKIFESLVKFLKEDISIILTHHHRKASMFMNNNKNASDEMRGSTDILAQIDCHLTIDNVSPDKKYLVISQPKNRVAENLFDFRIDIKKQEGSIRFKYAGKFTPADVAQIKVENHKGTVLNLIKENPGIMKDNIIVKLSGIVGVLSIKTILNQLEKESKIVSQTKKPKSYYIKEEISTLF